MSEHTPPLPEGTTTPAAHPSGGFPREIVLLPLLNVVIYPLTVTPLAISQEASVRLVDEAIAAHRMIGMVALRGAKRPDQVTPDDCYEVGTAAVLHRMVRLHDNTLRVAVEGVGRFQVEEVLEAEPALVARIRPLEDQPVDRAARAEARLLTAAAAALARRLPTQGAPVLEELAAEQDILRLSFLGAARLLMRSDLAERQGALELTRPAERLTLLRTIVERDLAALEEQP
ncbi:MAG: hypothetical protein RLZZ387_2420 [Chloroflexota bacterium]